MSQQTEALNRGNSVRVAGGEIREQLAQGTITPSVALGDPRAAALRIDMLLTSVPKIGPKKARRLLSVRRIDSGSRVRDLTSSQLVSLLDYFNPVTATTAPVRISGRVTNPAAAPTSVRHRAASKARAVELSAEPLALTPTEIRRQLALEGVEPVPTLSTVIYWTDPDAYERARRRDAAAKRQKRAERAVVRWPGVCGPEWRFARIRVLAGANLTSAAIAAVMAVDFPNDPQLDVEHIETALRNGTPPTPYGICGRLTEASA